MTLVPLLVARPAAHMLDGTENSKHVFTCQHQAALLRQLTVINPHQWLLHFVIEGRQNGGGTKRTTLACTINLHLIHTCMISPCTLCIFMAFLILSQIFIVFTD